MHTYVTNEKPGSTRSGKKIKQGNNLKHQFTLKRSVVAVALTLASSHLVMAQEAIEAPLKGIVTGSNIKRIDGETAAPVTILRREDIKATGANTVRQVLDTLTSFDTGTLRDDGSSTSFARGASGASMRGLGKGATLVLVNGRRVSNYAFADGGKDVFVNLDAIPADVIDRVEVLKTALRLFTVPTRCRALSTSSPATPSRACA